MSNLAPIPAAHGDGIGPCVTYHRFIPTQRPNMDVRIVRENEERCYAGMEYGARNGKFAHTLSQGH